MALNDLFAAAVRNASGKASDLLRKPVLISVKGVQQGAWDKVSGSLKGFTLALPVSYTNDVSGTGVTLLDARQAALIAELMFENDPKKLPDELTELQMTAAGEALGQIIGAMAEGLGKAAQCRLQAATGEPTQVSSDGQAAARAAIKEAQVAVVDCTMKIGDHEESNVVHVLPGSLAAALLAERPAGGAAPEISLGAPQVAGPGGTQRVQPVAFGTVSAPPGAEAASAGNLDLLLDVPLEMTVELGRSTRRVRDVLALGPGSVVELTKLAGEPVDLLVNGKPIAKGEVVVIDENFAVRIIEILAREERLTGGL